MTRQELIEIALTGSRGCEIDEDATNLYVDLAEHLITRGHASTITEIDTILEGMSVEDQFKDYVQVDEVWSELGPFLPQFLTQHVSALVALGWWHVS